MRRLKNILNYLVSLTGNNRNKKGDEFSPFVKSLSTGAKIPADIDYKKGYSDFLFKKYK